MDIMVLFLIVFGLLLLAKLFIAIWVYKDAKEKSLNPMVWMILIIFFSAPITFLLYYFVSRENNNIVCKNCNYVQSDKLLYCGRCGSKMEIGGYEEFNKINSKKFLYIGIFLLALSLTIGVIGTVASWNGFDRIPISVMNVTSKYGGKWEESFKYKNGTKTHNYKIKDKTVLNGNWDIEDGELEAKFYHNDKLIKEIYSKDKSKYNELIDLSEYSGEKVKLELKFIKTSGKFSFILEE